MTRIAVIGCGTVARRIHLPGFRAAGADIVAFASRSLSSAEAAAGEWGSGDATDDWRSVIQRDDVDAVDICSPNTLHAEQAVAAAECGKHVLVEKPMATTTEDATAMVGAAVNNGVVLQVFHNLRYVGPFVAAQQAVAQGRIGSLVSLRAAFGHGGPQQWAPDAEWFFDRKLSGGGALMDLGIHMVDLIGFITGATVTEVAAFLSGGSASGTSSGSVDVEEGAQLLLRFAAGATGSMHASWAANPAPDHQITIFGTEGLLHLDGRTPLTFKAADGSIDEPLEPPTDLGDPCAAFLATIAGEDNGAVTPASGSDGAAAVAIVEAAYASARSGKTVKL